MAFCLISDLPGGAARGGKASRGVTFNVRRLSIGSAPDQELHLPLAGVDPRHAVITAARDGQLLLDVLSRRGCHRQHPQGEEGEPVAGVIGSAVITVEKPLSSRLFVLRVEEPQQADGAEGCSERETPGLSISFWSWAFTVGVTMIFLAVPLAGVMLPPLGKVLRAAPLLPSDALWNPGPLHAAHQSIGANCNACHRSPFVQVQVQDQECRACHADVQHHVDIRSTDVSLFEGETCASCHREHKQPAALVQSDPRLCTDCHAHLERLKPRTGAAGVADFGREHPDFRVTVLAGEVNGWHSVRLDRRQADTFIEHSHLRFSHRQHLNPRGIKTPTGDRVLTCQECHKPDASGQEMVPINMEAQCIRCHSLRFDEHDPASALPHGNLQRAFRAVEEHFSHQYLQIDPVSAPTLLKLSQSLLGASASRSQIAEQSRELTP
jgi:predicted CXXCH cytochrome family protein